MKKPAFFNKADVKVPYEIGRLQFLQKVLLHVFTDIEKDGLMEGVSVNQLVNLLEKTKLNVIASGGVSSLDDLKKLKQLEKKNLIGVISGKAIYENKFSVNEAIEILEN